MDTTIMRTTAVTKVHAKERQKIRLCVRRFKRRFDLGESSAWRNADRRYAYIFIHERGGGERYSRVKKEGERGSGLNGG